MRYKTLIFDLDGTLLNTLQDLAAATNYTLKKHGFPERSMDEVRMFVGNGIRKLIQRAVPAGTSEAVQEQVFVDFNVLRTIPYADSAKLFFTEDFYIIITLYHI